jgi:dolichol-phosphate mannosyltransferase
MKEEQPLISIVVPVYNEEEVLQELYRRVSQALEDFDDSWELILVNDGSADDSARIIRELNQQDPRVKGVSFSRNFGFQEAVTAG